MLHWSDNDDDVKALTHKADLDTGVVLSIVHAALCLARQSSGLSAMVVRRISKPLPGDLVVEASRGMRALDAMCIGRVVGTVVDDAAVIECLNGSRQRWENAYFVAVPTVELLREVGA